MFNTDNIKKIRIMNNKTQSDVAKELNVTRSSYAMWESNNNIFPIPRLIDFCNLFNVSLDYIFSFTNKMQYKKHHKNIDKIISGNRLKEIRKENKLTQEGLANKLNVARTIISKYEKGEYLIATHTLYTICKKYNISADYLLSKVDNPKYLN